MIAIRHGTLSVETVAGEMRRLLRSAGSRDTHMASAVRANCIHRYSVHVHICGMMTAS